MKSTFLLLILSSLLSGCGYYATVSYEFMQPAKINFVPEIKSPLIIENSKIDSSMSIKKVYINSQLQEEDSINISLFGDFCNRELAQTVYETNFFDSLYLDTIPRSYGVLHQNYNRIDSICLANNAEALFELDKYEINTTIQVENIANSYLASSTLISKGIISWNIYDQLNHKYLANISLQDTFIYFAEGTTVEDAYKRLPSDEAVWIDFAQSYAKKAVPILTPTWKKESRWVYYSSATLYENAYALSRNNKWEEASKIWFYIYQKGKAEDKARASFNMALAFEMNNDIQKAMEWMTKANLHLEQSKKMSSYDKSMFKKYSAVITKRKKALDELSEQIGIQPQ